MSAFNKLEYELYALLALNQSFPQFVQPPIVKEESPDWLDTENEIGIEVSRAESTQIGYAKNLANQYLGKQRDCIPNKRIERFNGMLYFDNDDCLYAVSDTKGLFDADRHICFALNSAEGKLNKLNSSHFCSGKDNCLFLYLTFSLLEGDGELFLSQYNELIKKYEKCYNHIFLMGHEEICHIDIRKQETSLVSFDKSCIEGLDKAVHALGKLSAWEKGTAFFPEYKKLFKK